MSSASSPSSDPSAKPQLSTLSKIAVFLMIVLGTSVVMYGFTPEITVESTTQRLKNVGEHIAADAANAGDQAALAYGNAQQEGWGYDKYVMVDSILLTFTSGENERSWGLLAPKANVQLDPLHDRRQIFRLHDQLKVLENGKTAATVSYTTPIRFGFLGGLDSKLQSTEVTVRVPPKITITPEPDAAGAQSPATVISYDGYPEINIHDIPSKRQRDIKYEFRNILIEQGGETRATIGALATDGRESANADKRIEGQFTVTVSDFTLHGSDKSAQTCSLTSNLSYESDMSLLTVFEFPALGAFDMKVNKLVIACDDFGIKIDGGFTRGKDEALPVGQVNVSIDNVKAFLGANILPEGMRNEIAAALPRITGQPLDALTNVSFSIRREKNGPLQIGETTLAAAGITALSKGAQALEDERVRALALHKPTAPSTPTDIPAEGSR